MQGCCLYISPNNLKIWILYYLKLACLAGVWISVITTSTAIYSTAERNEMGSYCHCVFLWKCSMNNCNWPHSCYERFGLIFLIFFPLFFFFSPLPLRIEQNLERNFQVWWSCLCVGFFVLFIYFFVLFLYDSEETYRTEKRCWQKHRSQKICHNFSFCFAKQLK